MKRTQLVTYLDQTVYNDVVADPGVRRVVFDSTFDGVEPHCQVCDTPEPEAELCLSHVVSIYKLAAAGIPREIADDPRNLIVVCKPCLTDWKQPNPFEPGKLYLRSREYGYKGFLHGGFMAPGYATLADARKSLDHLKSSPHRTKPTDDVSIYACTSTPDGIENRPIEGPQAKQKDGGRVLRFEHKPSIDECKLVLEAIEKNALRLDVVDMSGNPSETTGSEDAGADFNDDEIEHKIAVAAFRSYRGQGFRLAILETQEPESLIRALKKRCVEMIAEAD